MQLRRIAETGIDQDAGSVWSPAPKRGTANTLVLSQFGKDFRRNHGNLLGFNRSRFTSIGLPPQGILDRAQAKNQREDQNQLTKGGVFHG